MLKLGSGPSPSARIKWRLIGVGPSLNTKSNLCGSPKATFVIISAPVFWFVNSHRMSCSGAISNPAVSGSPGNNIGFCGSVISKHCEGRICVHSSRFIISSIV